MLYCGTHDGLYTVENGTVDLELDCGRVWSIAVDGTFVIAATKDGLYWSEGGASWTNSQIDGEPTAVVSVEGELLVGTTPVGVYRGSVRQEGNRFTPVGDLAAHPHSQRWNDRAQTDHSSVRTLTLHPADGILAGLEPGGVYAFDGEFWRQYGDGVHDDVHDLLVLDDGDVVAATGNGLYRTSNGEQWIRLDVDFRDFWANYFREAVAHEGRLITSGNHVGPEAPGGSVLDGPVDGDERTDTFGLDARPVPTAEPAFVISWAVDDGVLYGGTMVVGETFKQDEPAQLLAKSADGWESVAELPAGITALAATGKESSASVNVE